MLIKSRILYSNKTAPPVKIPPPACKDCKWSSGNVCKLFSLKSVDFNSELVRKNTDLCGPDGIYFKPK
jgi:hypothetical protein